MQTAPGHFFWLETQPIKRCFNTHAGVQRTSARKRIMYWPKKRYRIPVGDSVDKKEFTKTDGYRYGVTRKVNR